MRFVNDKAVKSELFKGQGGVLSLAAVKELLQACFKALFLTLKVFYGTAVV